MKTGIHLSDLASELQRQLDSKADYKSDTRNLSLDTLADGESVEHQLRVEGVGTFGVTDYAHGQLASRLKIPKPYYDRLRGTYPDLLGENVNTILHGEPERHLIRTLDGKARAFLSDRYRRIDNWDLAEAVLPILTEIPGAKVMSADLTETRMYIKIAFPGIEAEVKAGDVIQAGCVVQNSEVGAGSLGTYPWLLRLVCLNGMKRVEDGIRRIHVGRKTDDSEEARQIFSDETMRLDDLALFAKVKDVVRSCANQAAFDALVAPLRDLVGIRVEEPVGTVERLADRHGLTGDEQESILTHLIDGGDLSAWGVVNAVTRASADVESYDRADELESLGAALAYVPGEWVAA